MTTMREDKGADYVDHWTTQMATKHGTTPEGVLRFARKHGVDTIGDLTPEQARAVAAELRFYSRDGRQAYEDKLARAAAMVPACDNCGDCTRCC